MAQPIEQADDFLWDEQPEEACGIFGVYSNDEDCNAAALTYLGLYALQHRGQESAGMVVSDGTHVSVHKNMGLVSNVFNRDILDGLRGRIGIGHVRYSTTGSSLLANAQPLLARCSKGMLAVAHNGNLVNTEDLRKELENGGSVFQTSTDTEVIMNLVARHSRENLADAILKAAQSLKGSYSLVIMSKDALIGLRDPYGVRPMCLGKLADAYILASESCAFSSIGARFIRDIQPGELVMIDRDGLRSYHLPPAPSQAICIFEYIYFARPDSNIDGLNVHMARKAMGRELAKLFQHEADVVIPVPDTGLSTAIGFAEASGIPYDIGLIKNTYVGRTFIQPNQALRDMGVRIKLNPVESVLQGKRVVIIDDTIVRGTTSGKIIHLLREAGAKEVHMCVSAPPITHPCYYGIDTSVRKELIASSHSVEEIRRFIGADSLNYLSLEALYRAVEPKEGLCVACFNGNYPITIPQEESRDKFLLEE
ncbi:amidophosphoribosyltransferase [Hydrogenispora ethanolica]|uniref:Amidophosphoribosyltransferase n=1 Tax=Hydrogenispora ethanolica TaxID=1082276 RepID=A0A4R1QVY0_HYDET|nr:amidophosphoribosyltransferase [Hydrogenispora ethanolica]TCL54400.1 amidophosphoribosyltransferase [Hydrogenispora ethanolica]